MESCWGWRVDNVGVEVVAVGSGGSCEGEEPEEPEVMRGISGIMFRY